jgi:anion-transporting  ArsA/GET3 family ATPase
LQQALHSRGDMIEYILRDEQTYFFVVCSADPRRMKEALFFHEKLAELGQRASAFIINRVIPAFQAEDLDGADAATLASLTGGHEQASSELDELRAELFTTYEELTRMAARDRAAIDTLSKQVGERLLRRVPMLGEDVHSLDQLAALSLYLTPSSR